MGIIRQQTIKGSFISYVGAILGFINTSLLYPNLFATDQIGLIAWLGAITTVAAQFSTLGFNNVTARLFPYFRNENVNHNGFLFILFWVGMAGFVFSLVAYFILEPVAVERYQDESPLYLNYLIYLIPLVFFTLFYNLFEGYNRVMYDAISGTFFRDIVFKVLNLTFLVLFWQDVIDFSQFILLYVLAYCSPTVFLFIVMWVRGHISFASNLKFVTPELRKSMTSVSLFGILNGLSDKLANQIDRIMIEGYIGLASTGIFATMANFGTLVSMPSRSLRKIASTVIAEAWKKNDLETINQIYSKSGLHQFMVGCLLFIGIWINVDNIFEIVSDRFIDGKYVVFFIGLSHVVQMLSGVSGVVLVSSPAYKMQTVFMVSLGLLVIITNVIMIPIWGITGAAIASLTATFIFNLSKYLYLLKKYKFQPFNYKYLLVIIIALIAYYCGTILPEIDWFVLDIAVRSSIVGGVYLLLLFAFKISDDYNQFVKKMLHIS